MFWALAMALLLVWLSVKWARRRGARA